jgi:hypothetical protein
MSFAGDLLKFQKNFEKKSNDAFGKIVFDVGESVLKLTPVDTGRARGNWQYGINTSPIGTTESTVEPIPELRTTAGSVEIGDEVNISNNLPYIEALEDGHSQQAANGMVKITVTKWKPIVAKVMRQVFK